MNEELKKRIFIGLFTILYVMTGLVSVWHAVGFFRIANPIWMAWVLALVFEVGQAAALFSILTGGSNRVSWGLMGILTVIQVMGNVYSCYAEVRIHPEMAINFAGPFFGPHSTIPPENQAVIIAYIMGAILPVVALCLTAVVARYLTRDSARKNNASGDIKSTENSHIFSSEKEQRQVKNRQNCKVFIDN